MPKQFKFFTDRFYNQRSKSNILYVDHRHHQAWNVLTNSSSMTLEEIADSLSRFIPDDVKFTIQRR